MCRFFGLQDGDGSCVDFAPQDRDDWTMTLDEIYLGFEGSQKERNLDSGPEFRFGL